MIFYVCSKGIVDFRLPLKVIVGPYHWKTDKVFFGPMMTQVPKSWYKYQQHQITKGVT